jgi:hypothetical protein
MTLCASKIKNLLNAENQILSLEIFVLPSLGLYCLGWSHHAPHLSYTCDTVYSFTATYIHTLAQSAITDFSRKLFIILDKFL